MKLTNVRLAEVLGGRDNNLNLVRMIAAILVLVSHAYAIAGGPGTAEPLLHLTGQTLGHYAVAVFFGISGLLIARSFDRRSSMVHFTASRILRLYPALLVVLLLTVIAGVFLTTLPAGSYAVDPQTWTYVPANLSLAFLQYPLPGVFETNSYGPPINGSLWTLFYEVVCYGGVVAIGLAGALRSRLFALLVLLAVTATYLALPTLANHGWKFDSGVGYRLTALSSLAFPFMLGTFAYVWREHIPMSGVLALILVLAAIAALGSWLAPPLILLAIVYGTLWFGLVPKGRLLAYNCLGDFSYGTYIYAFPVQQTLVFLLPGMSPLENMLLALPVTLVFAVLSWTLVESRALALARPAGDICLPWWLRLTGRTATARP